MADNRVLEWLESQPAFGRLKSKWEELDPKAQLWVRMGGAGLLGLVVAIVALTQYWSARSARNEYEDKAALLALIDSSADELRSLRSASGLSDESAESWSAYVQATSAPTAATVEEKPVALPTRRGAAPPSRVETLVQVSVAELNLRQLTRVVYQLENGRRPLKLRELTITAKDDLSGYLSAQMTFSGYSSGATE